MVTSTSIDRLPRLTKRRKKGRYHVLLLRSIPGAWKPASPHSMPRFVESARFIARGLKCSEACVVAQSYNALQLDSGYRDGTWAVVVSAMFGVQPKE